MTEHQHRKPWYKKWWGIIIAVVILPYFLLWFVWAKTKWSKRLKAFTTLVLIGLVVLDFVWLANSARSQPTSPSHPISAEKGAPTLAKLDSQAASILTVATNSISQIMLTGQTYAAQKNALNVNPDSSFEKWRNTLLKVPNNVTNTAYNKAVAIYTSDKKPVPSTLKAWKTDNSAVLSDISLWQLAEVTLLVSEQGGSTSAEVQSDQSTSASDYKLFLTDLTKARSDVSKLSGKSFVSTVNLSTAPKVSAQQPTVSLATLNGQTIQNLTAATGHYSQLMDTVRSDAAQGDAATNYNGAFKVWYRKSLSNVDNTAIKAYNAADNSYYNAHQNVPAALENWDNGIEQVYTDITTYTNDQEQLFADQVLGNDTTNDQSTVNSDIQTYNNNLAKAQADILQI